MTDHSASHAALSAGGGISGSRNGTLRCTGPPAPAAAIAHASRAACAAIDGVDPGSSGQGRSRKKRACEPYSPIWSMVCDAPVLRSSGGRSAVSTTSGTPASDASTTAGR